MIACEVHPVNNLRVLQYLEAEFGQNIEGKKAWFNHWVHTTFAPLEVMLGDSAETGLCCHGDQPTLADICLYAQVWNNRRFEVDTRRYPAIERIFHHLDTLPAFARAAPPEQPDAV